VSYTAIANEINTRERYLTCPFEKYMSFVKEMLLEKVRVGKSLLGLRSEPLEQGRRSFVRRYAIWIATCSAGNHFTILKNFRFNVPSRRIL